MGHGTTKQLGDRDGERRLQDSDVGRGTTKQSGDQERRMEGGGYKRETWDMGLLRSQGTETEIGGYK